MVFKKLFSPSQRIAGFRYAFQGLSAFMRGEPHAWIHLLATVLVLTGIWYFPMATWETIVLLLCIGMVWCAEILNACIEKTMDLLHPGPHRLVKLIKDMAAAAVLVTSIIALAVGLIIFIPKFLQA